MSHANPFSLSACLSYIFKTSLEILIIETKQTTSPNNTPFGPGETGKRNKAPCSNQASKENMAPSICQLPSHMLSPPIGCVPCSTPPLPLPPMVWLESYSLCIFDDLRSIPVRQTVLLVSEIDRTPGGARIPMSRACWQVRYVLSQILTQPKYLPESVAGSA